MFYYHFLYDENNSDRFHPEQDCMVFSNPSIEKKDNSV